MKALLTQKNLKLEFLTKYNLGIILFMEIIQN